MNQFLIVGYGNTIRGDDGLGPLVAGRLDDNEMPPGIRGRIICLPQIDITLLTVLPEVDFAIFVDARQDNDDALIRVDRIMAKDIISQNHMARFNTHSTTISTLLSLVLNWYGKELCCYFIKPKGFDFSFQETVSEKARITAYFARQSIYQILWAHYHDQYIPTEIASAIYK